MQKYLVIFQISLYMSMYLSRYFCKHDDVIEWKHFPRYWPFVRGIQRSPVNSPHKGQWREALVFSLICALNKRLSKQSWGWWFEMPTRSLWLHCNECLRCCHQTSQGLCVTHRKQLSVVQNAMISIHAHLICMKEPACVCDLCGICYFENGINHQGITRPLCQIWLAEWILSASNPTILYDCWLLLWHQMNENGYVVSPNCTEFDILVCTFKAFMIYEWTKFIWFAGFCWWQCVDDFRRVSSTKFHVSSEKLILQIQLISHGIDFITQCLNSTIIA